jgi:hypothetical protein
VRTPPALPVSVRDTLRSKHSAWNGARPTTGRLSSLYRLDRPEPRYGATAIPEGPENPEIVPVTASVPVLITETVLLPLSAT